MAERGALLAVTRARIVERALSQLTAIPTAPPDAPADAGGRPIHYRLQYPNGGTDPFSSGCHAWANGLRVPAADCVGFALWAIGIDRKQPGYTGTAGVWLHCPSIIDDADGQQAFFAAVASDEALPGDLLITDRHVGVIIATPTVRDHLRGVFVRPALSWARNGERVSIAEHRWVLAELKQPIVVVDCSTRHGAPEKVGLGVGIGGAWSPSCRVVRRVHWGGVAARPDRTDATVPPMVPDELESRWALTGLADAVVAACAAAALVFANHTRRVNAV